MAMPEQDPAELKARVERLEAAVRRLEDDQRPVMPSASGESLDQEQLLAWLKAEGLVRNPTPEERRLAAEWEILSEEEKQAHIRFMQSLTLDTPLSQIIIDNRR